MKTKLILLVEDDPKDVELTLLALEEYNLQDEVAVVRDGAEALDYLYRRREFTARSEGAPVVILLDLKMPKVSGLEVLRILKKDPKLKTISTVVLTSSREDRDLKECYQLGVNAYVVKPVVFDKFMHVIQDLALFWVMTNEPSPE